jgi:glucoside 3-dehydrogenase (cytochrome c) hitch-hiker subunit
MNRRQSLVGIAALAAHALFPEVLERFALASHVIASTDRWEPELLSAVQGALLADVMDTIVPATDTPGAKAARVHVFVDLALARCVSPPQQRQVLAAIDSLPNEFGTLAVAEQQRRLAQLPPDAFGLLRELTVLGYCTSEIGTTQGMAYDPVPGGYRGCVELKPGQRAWATR